MEKRRRFSKEFKREAIPMATGANLSIKPVAADVRIHANVLRRWCREQEQDGSKAFRGQGVPRDEEVVRLKQELAWVKKDAAAVFAKDTMRDMP